jgi:AbrB family looped-hinge helix DNA binding protein
VSSYVIEALVTIDGCGQILIPIGVRKTANIQGGEKLAVITLQNQGDVGRILLVKVQKFIKIIEQLCIRLLNETLRK